MNNCPFKNLFGIPRQGIHKYRFMDIAIIDVVATILLALVLSKIFKINILLIFIGLIILSIFIHKLFCVETTLTKMFYKN